MGVGRVWWMEGRIGTRAEQSSVAREPGGAAAAAVRVEPARRVRAGQSALPGLHGKQVLRSTCRALAHADDSAGQECVFVCGVYRTALGPSPVKG